MKSRCNNILSKTSYIIRSIEIYLYKGNRNINNSIEKTTLKYNFLRVHEFTLRAPVEFVNATSCTRVKLR